MQSCFVVVASLCLYISVGLCANTRLRIVHNNDMHSRLDQTSQLSGKCSDADISAGKCYGGYARISTAINEQRRLAKAEGYPLLVLNAGDSFQGTIWYSWFKWPIVAAFNNLLNFDAMSLGNHEFDDQVDGMAPYLKNLSVPTVSCNIGLEGEPDLGGNIIKPSIVLERGGLKIGIIGYLTPETSTLAKPGNIVFYDEIEKISEEAKKLKESGVNIIIGLGHSGYQRDIEIAQQSPDVDLIVGGHSHSFLYTGKAPDNDIPVGPYPTVITQKSGRIVPVVQAYAYTKYLGVLDVFIDDKGEVINATGSPILLDSSVEEDPELLLELNQWKQLMGNVTQEQIATTRVTLNGSCRFFECNLGNIATDAFVDYGLRNVAEGNWTKAAIAIYSGGGVRASIDSSEGTITREDIIVVFPFYNQIALVSVRGRYLLEALEWSVTRYDPDLVVGRGEFLQMSGIHVLYDLTKPAGSRVVSLKVRCAKCPYPQYEPVDPDALYSIITSSYIATGGDNFTMIANNSEEFRLFDSMDTDVISEYIRNKQLLYDGTEERISFVGSSSRSHHHGRGAANNLVINNVIFIFVVYSSISHIFL